MDTTPGSVLPGRGTVMAEFQMVMQELQRMCNSCKTCRQCRINDIRNDECDVWIARNPKEAEQIIMQWSSEHPIKTNGMKFREVFGINLDSIEVVCRDGEGKVSYYQDVSAWLDKEYKGKDGQDEQN